MSADDPGFENKSSQHCCCFFTEHRYIELFLNSTPAGRQNYGPGGGFNGGGGAGNMGNMGGGYGDGEDFDESEDFEGKIYLGFKKQLH